EKDRRFGEGTAKPERARPRGPALDRGESVAGCFRGPFESDGGKVRPGGTAKTRAPACQADRCGQRNHYHPSLHSHRAGARQRKRAKLSTVPEASCREVPRCAADWRGETR